jgi:hypothetical protein
MLSSGSFEPSPEDIDDGFAAQPPKSTPASPPRSPTKPSSPPRPSSPPPAPNPEQPDSDISVSTEVQPFSDRSVSFHDRLDRVCAFIAQTERRWAAEDRLAAVDPETAASARVIAAAPTCPIRRKLLSLGVLGVACAS